VCPQVLGGEPVETRLYGLRELWQLSPHNSSPERPDSPRTRAIAHQRRIHPQHPRPVAAELQLRPSTAHAPARKTTPVAAEPQLRRSTAHAPARKTTPVAAELQLRPSTSPQPDRSRRSLLDQRRDHREMMPQVRKPNATYCSKLPDGSRIAPAPPHAPRPKPPAHHPGSPSARCRRPATAPRPPRSAAPTPPRAIRRRRPSRG